MNIPSIGIIGAGFVGGAISDGFKQYTDVKVYDKNKDLGCDYKDVIQQDILFVCLPTPMQKDGSVDLSTIQNALERLSETLPTTANKAVLLKSTVPPGACKHFQDQFKNLEIIFNPEFLTERTANLDFMQQRRVILGIGTNPEIPTMNLVLVKQLYKARLGKIRIVFVHWDFASLVKYGTNSFFCTKISFFNEIHDAAAALGFKGNDIVEEILEDGRIGKSHWQVPGHDGKRGFGGSCFPKDINGFMTFARKLGVEPIITRAAWVKNCLVRPERDWEQLKGRAVSDEEDVEV